jgi:hypothetical protein
MLAKYDALLPLAGFGGTELSGDHFVMAYDFFGALSGREV